MTLRQQRHRPQQRVDPFERFNATDKEDQALLLLHADGQLGRGLGNGMKTPQVHPRGDDTDFTRVGAIEPDELRLFGRRGRH